MDHEPTVWHIEWGELLEFCSSAGYRCRLEPAGSLLIPPDYNVGMTDWEKSLKLRKGGADRTVSIRLQAPPASPPRDQRTLSGRQPLQGATVINLSPAAADEFGLDPFQRGVLIIKIGNGFAARLGFQAGDILRKVNGRPVSTVAEAASALSTVGVATLTIERNGEEINARF